MSSYWGFEANTFTHVEDTQHMLYTSAFTSPLPTLGLRQGRTSRDGGMVALFENQVWMHKRQWTSNYRRVRLIGYTAVFRIVRHVSVGGGLCFIPSMPFVENNCSHTPRNNEIKCNAQNG